MGFWSKIKNAAKSVVKWAGNKIKGAAKFLVKLAITAGNFVFGAVASIFLPFLQKKLRLHVCILHPPGETELVSVAEAEASVARATKIINDSFDVKVVHYGNPYVTIVKETPPDSALNTECYISSYGSVEFNEAGSFFGKYTAGWNAIPTTLVYPITIFIVKSIEAEVNDPRGCSFGPLTDYLVITPDGLNDPTTLAHEIGHACNLLDRKTDADRWNLMYVTDPRGISVSGWQKWAFRTSRHVNFW